jgi:serine/threonine protein kinase
MTININDILKKRYQIVKKLPSGGQAHIYIANDKNCHNKPVVIKTPINPADKNRLYNEAQSLSKLQHRSIVPILDAEQDWIALEYIDGESLEVYLGTHKKNLEQTKSTIKHNEIVNDFIDSIFKVSIEIVRVICFLHQKQIKHGDLSLKNIIIRDKIHPVLIDFGLIKPSHSNNTSPSRPKTAPFTAPEVSIPPYYLTEQSEIYAIGAILYFCFSESILFNLDYTYLNTGVVSITNSSSTDWLNAHERRIPNSISFVAFKKKSQSSFEKMDNIILKCLEKNPQDRYFTADELLKDILDAYDKYRFDVISEMIHQSLPGERVKESNLEGKSFNCDEICLESIHLIKRTEKNYNYSVDKLFEYIKNDKSFIGKNFTLSLIIFGFPLLMFFIFIIFLLYSMQNSLDSLGERSSAPVSCSCPTPTPCPKSDPQPSPNPATTPVSPTQPTSELSNNDNHGIDSKTLDQYKYQIETESGEILCKSILNKRKEIQKSSDSAFDGDQCQKVKKLKQF